MLMSLMILAVGMALLLPIKIHACNNRKTLLKSAISDPASLCLAGLVLAGAAIVVTAPLWPILEMHRVGLMIFTLGCGFSFLFSFAVVYDDIQFRKQKSVPTEQCINASRINERVIRHSLRGPAWKLKQIAVIWNNI